MSDCWAPTIPAISRSATHGRWRGCCDDSSSIRPSPGRWLAPCGRVPDCSRRRARRPRGNGCSSAFLLRPVQGDGIADQRLQGLLVDLLALAEVDRATHVALEAGVEELRRIL